MIRRIEEGARYAVAYLIQQIVAGSSNSVGEKVAVVVHDDRRDWAFGKT